MKHLTSAQRKAMFAGRKNYINPTSHDQQRHSEHLKAFEREPFYKKTDGHNDYDIVRFYSNHRNPRVMQRALTRRDAERHCSNPRTRKEGKWFDGFAKCGVY